MAKSSKVYVCSNCDAQFPKWMGQCTQCGKWGTVAEGAGSGEQTVKQERAAKVKESRSTTTTPFTKINTKDAPRVTTGLGEVDRVLGGGVVPGALMLLGGDPGIGKSTLVAQMAAGLKKPVLYISGEESAQQIKMRFDRMGIEQKDLSYVGDESVEVLCKTILDEKPALAIVDSIQTVATAGVESEPGSVNQIKASTVHFMETAKRSGVPIVIIGHVTKGGQLGGPKALEHLVDTVLYLEGDRNHHFRLLRAVKNRFGSTNEVGVFDMQSSGLVEVENPSEALVADRSQASGSCMTAVVEGNRTFLIEVQALVNRTTFGYPQRKSNGFDTNRLNMLLAVLERRAQLPLDQFDVYINVVGGMKFTEPAMDMAICMAVASALHDEPVPQDMIAWGEVGLGGELRSVSREKERLLEAKRFGMKRAISPKGMKTVAAAISAAKLSKKA